MLAHFFIPFTSQTDQKRSLSNYTPAEQITTPINIHSHHFTTFAIYPSAHKKQPPFKRLKLKMRLFVNFLFYKHKTENKWPVKPR